MQSPRGREKVPSAIGAGISGAKHVDQGEVREVGLHAELNSPQSSEHAQHTELTSKHDYCSLYKFKICTPEPHTSPDHPPLWSSQK